MIAIINYGLGNLRSVAGAVERLGFQSLITSDPYELARAERLILPGVGAFGDGMKKMHDRELTDVLTRLVLDKKKKILGICLGFQLMANESFEFGHHKGLGWINASVEKLQVSGGLRLPHVGWNNLFQRQKNVLFNEIPENALFYYVHSYHVNCTDGNLVIGECDYGSKFTAAIAQDNIFGTQFHPEKSQMWGLKLLHNFLTKV